MQSGRAERRKFGALQEAQLKEFEDSIKAKHAQVALLLLFLKLLLLCV